jgi:hypothetical protein
MNSELPIIKVTNSKITDKTLNDLNKLSALLLQRKNSSSMSGGKKKKSKTRKLKR